LRVPIIDLGTSTILLDHTMPGGAPPHCGGTADEKRKTPLAGELALDWW